MESGETKQLDPALLTLWYRQHSANVHAFLFGLLRNHALAEEALQATFTKALSHGGDVQSGSERAWLFQVAYNEAMAVRRRSGIHQRAIQTLTREQSLDFESPKSSAQRSSQSVESLLQWETVQQVRAAIEQLPHEQREIVLKRIYEEKTFEQIATELKVPLGTALTRMRAALAKLQTVLKHHHDN